MTLCFLPLQTNAVKIAKLSDDESVITNETNAESVPETNGIERTDMKIETHVSNGTETETDMKNHEKTEQNDIPITCDVNNKIDNLDVDVVPEDKNKGEIDSTPLIVDEVIKEKDELPMDVVDEKPSEIKVTEEIAMDVTPIDTELITKAKSDVDENDKSTKIVEDATAAVSEQVKEPVTMNPVVISEIQTEKTDVPEKVAIEEIDDKENVTTTTEIPSKQNGDHNNINVEIENDKLEEKKQQCESGDADPTNATVEKESNEVQNQQKDVELEKMDVTESDEQMAATNENGAKEKNDAVDNKENIPIDTIKEKENIIEIPIHIDGDIQPAQKPSIITATNGNGVSSKDDVIEVATATNSNKEKMSRIELIIEEKNNDNGQLTETTTHIVKEITIVKNNVCESAENVEILPENV